MKKFLLSLLAFVVVTIAALQFTAVQAFLLSLYLPPYPDWPEPQHQLDAEDRGEIFFATSSPFDLDVILAGNKTARPTTGHGYLSYPEGVSASQPVPAMVVVHGSGGISPGREHEYAELLNANGIAAFVIEYYEPRGMTDDYSYLMRTTSVTEFDLVADAYAALKLLGSSPLIDEQRIGVMGFSYGGMASRFAMDDRFREVLAPESPGFALYIDVYGPCFQDLRTRQTNGGPLLTLRGTEDASNDLPACLLREQQLRDIGVDVEAHVYEGAGHAWENFAERSMKAEAPYLSGCELSYDETGYSYLDGNALPQNALESSHPRRIVGRLKSGNRFMDCVGYGYIIGHDPETRQDAYRRVLNFLNRHFALAGVNVSD